MSISKIITAILLAAILTSCNQDTQNLDRKTDTVMTEAPVPPVELLRGSFEAASHVGLVDIKSLEVVDEIHADNGTVGYVVEQSAADLLLNYKGDFGGATRILFYNFLESPTPPEGARLDTMLVFLDYDDTKGRFMLIEVGQFRSSDSLRAIMAAISKKE